MHLYFKVLLLLTNSYSKDQHKQHYGLDVKNNEKGTQLTVTRSEKVPYNVVLEYRDNYQINNCLEGVKLEYSKIIIFMYYIIGYLTILGINILNIIYN